MTNIRDVKLATNAVKKLFPPIRDLCQQILKKHHVNHDGLTELDQAVCIGQAFFTSTVKNAAPLPEAPNKWDEVIRMAFDVKEQILPLQSEPWLSDKT